MNIDFNKLPPEKRQQVAELLGIDLAELETKKRQPKKPDADIRTELKKNGFKWAPSQGAWQNYRSDRAMRTAKEIVAKLAQ